MAAEAQPLRHTYEVQVREVGRGRFVFTLRIDSGIDQWTSPDVPLEASTMRLACEEAEQKVQALRKALR